MPFATLDRIKTHYIAQGSGPCLLMMAPRGFESTLQSWDHGKWADMNAVATLSRHFSVIAYDRREAGASGGRVEPLSWRLYARQAKLLMEHVGVEKAHVLGVCMGVGVASELASAHPESCASVILAHPVGGHRWRERMRLFFGRHIAYVQKNGLVAVCARAKGLNFMRDPEAGPWASTIASDPAFAESFVRMDVASYLSIVEQSRDGLFPDTFVSGPRPADLMTMDVPASIWPGDDASHSASGAHQLRELLPRMEYWDLHPTQQTAENMLDRLLSFTRTVETAGLPPSPPISGPSVPPVT